MQKEITFEYEGAKYTLAFTRKTVQQLSRDGFDPDMVTKHPDLGVPMLFRGAFLAHHWGMRNELKDKIYENITNRTALIKKLMSMYMEPITAMIEDPEESEKNLKWEANFEDEE